MRSLVIILLLLVSFSCSQSSSNSIVNRTELLANKKWKISGLSGKQPNGTVIPDGYSGLPEYMKDDYFFYKTDFTFIHNDNTNKRPGATTDIVDQGVWSLTNADTYLNLVSNTPGATYVPSKILELTSSSLKLESTDVSTGWIYWPSYVVIP
jgi:hypothetical protein